MRLLLCLTFIILSLNSCANTGSTVGNGLVSKTESEAKLKEIHKEQVKKCEKGGGKVITEEKTDFCLLKDSTKKPLSSL